MDMGEGIVGAVIFDTILAGIQGTVALLVLADWLRH
jgi:hypothetical protein